MTTIVPTAETATRRAARTLLEALGERLSGAPGRETLDTLLSDARAPALDAGVLLLLDTPDGNSAAWEPQTRSLRLKASEALYWVRCACALPPLAGQALRDADRRLGEATTLARNLGRPATDAIVLLYHAGLHVRAARGDGSLTDLCDQALTWSRDCEADWRAWSDARFGGLECIEWGGNGSFCRRMGYTYAGEVHAVHRVGERRAHQQRIWRALREQRLAPLLAARSRWQGLNAR